MTKEEKVLALRKISKAFIVTCILPCCLAGWYYGFMIISEGLLSPYTPYALKALVCLALFGLATYFGIMKPIIKHLENKND